MQPAVAAVTPRFLKTPDAAVHLGLALHELIVNSASHGALSTGATTISIHCDETSWEGRKAIKLQWSESIAGARSGSDFEDRSFGRTVLERVVPTSVNGQAEFTMTPNLIEYGLVIPESEFDTLHRA